MYHLGLLLHDACCVSRDLVRELARLERGLPGGRPGDRTLVPAARRVTREVHLMRAAALRLATQTVSVQRRLEPALDALWDGLVAATAGGLAALDEPARASWQRAAERLEELSLLVGVVGEQVPHALRHNPQPKEATRGRPARPGRSRGVSAAS